MQNGTRRETMTFFGTSSNQIDRMETHTHEVPSLTLHIQGMGNVMVSTDVLAMIKPDLSGCTDEVLIKASLLTVLQGRLPSGVCKRIRE